MQEVIQFGPFIVKLKWLIIAVSGLLGYGVLKYRLKGTNYSKDIMLETFEKMFLMAIVVWKFSLILFSPITVVTNPLALLYFSGGNRGALLALAVLAIYLYHQTRKQQTSIWVYLDALAVGGLASLVLYHLLALVLKEPLVFHGTQSILSLLALFWLFKRSETVGNPYHLNLVLLWYSLGQIFISYITKSYGNFLGGFSKEQILFFTLAFISLAIEWLKDLRTAKKA